MIDKKSNVKFSIQKILFYVAGTGTLIWFLLRVIPKPSRAAYPCMRAAAPVASGFVLYLLGLFSTAALLRKSKHHYVHSRYFPAFLFLMAAMVAGLTTTMTSDTPAYANQLTFSQPANAPVGAARGVNPGRVLWIFNPDATNKNCTNAYGDGWFLTKNNNQAVIDQMVSSAIQSLTGSANDQNAWNAIFRYYNQNHGKGSVPYASGEKILVKINATSGWAGNYSTSDLSKINNGNYDIAETSPQVVLSVLRQLVNVAGVAQSDIYIGDPMKHIYKHCYDLWHSEFPNVIYLDHDNYSSLGRVQVTKSATPLIYYSDKGTVLGATVLSDQLYTIFQNVEYMINIPQLKGHARAGITLFAKNHLGSHCRDNANHMHPGLVAPNGGNDVRPGAPLYRIQVDLMGHELLGGKELFYLLDALWAGSEAINPPDIWKSAPFNTDWSSSIFASQDPVAIESVAFDFLRTEYTDVNHPGLAYPQKDGTDDYLHQTADPSLRPPGITYDPENDGTALTTSLGVHEHWNNAVNKQYTRNLGTGNGIELIYPAIWSGLTGTDWNNAANWWTGVVPSSATDVIITTFSTNQPVITGSPVAICHHLTLLPGTSLTISPGGALSVSGDLTAGGTLTIESGAVDNNGSLIVEGTSVGTVTCKRQLRTVSNYGDYHYVSPPVSGQAIAGFRSSDNFPATVWEWQENNATPWQTVATGNFVSGRGYNLDQSGGSGQFAFTGPLVTTPPVITATAPYTASGTYANDRGTWGGGGCNLLGNPFTSAMDASKFITANLSSFDPNYQALYIYDGVSNLYQYAASGVPGDPMGDSFGTVIQSGQGFFVFPTCDGLPFTFVPGSGASGIQTHNTSLEMKSAPVPWPGMRLKVKYRNGENSTLVVYHEKMSTGLDPGYDVGLMSASPEVEIYTTLVEDNGVNFARQALPISGNETRVVPVGIESEKGGEITFSASIFAQGNSSFFLEDRVTRKLTHLGREQYTVTLPALTAGTGRFFIHCTLTTQLHNLPLWRGQGGADGDFRIWTTGNRVNIEGAVSHKATGVICDLLGRQLFQTRLSDTQFNTITVPLSVKGVYLVKIVDGEKILTRKVVF